MTDKKMTIEEFDAAYKSMMDAYVSASAEAVRQMVKTSNDLDELVSNSAIPAHLIQSVAAYYSEHASDEISKYFAEVMVAEK